MTLAVNAAGDVLSDASGAWLPAPKAVNQAGDVLIHDGDIWRPAPTPPTPGITPTPFGDLVPAGTLPANSVVPPKSFAAPVGGEFGDLSAQDWAQGEQPSPSGYAPAARIGKAAYDAAMATEPVLPPSGQALVDKYLDPFTARTIVKPGAQLLTGAIGTGRGLIAGLSQAAMEVFGEKGGRDALALAAVLPALHGEVPVPREAPGASAEAPSSAPYQPVTVKDVMARDGVGIDEAYRTVLAENAAGRGEKPPPTETPQTLSQWTAANAEDPASVVADRVMDTTNVDDAAREAAAAIRTEREAAAARPYSAPSPYTPVTVKDVMVRDGVDADTAFKTVMAENARGAAMPDASIPPGTVTDPLTGQTTPIAAPLAPRIMDLLREDARLTRERPAELPPSAQQPPPEATLRPVDEPVAAASAVEPERPLPAGAQSATPAEAAMAFEDMKANRRRAELDEIQAPPEANDRNIYVEGSVPTQAEYSGDANVSQLETLLRERRASHFHGEGKVLTEANRARVAAIDSRTVPDPTLNTMRRNRAAAFQAMSKDILPGSKPLDFTAAAEWAKSQLADPRIQENDAVVSVLRDIQKRLYDANGDLKTNPASGWGLHDQLQNMLAKAKDPLLQTGAEKFAESQILQAKKLVDAAMNIASDNKFQAALDSYARDSQAINEGVLMNDLRLHLTNMQGDFQPARFHNSIINLAKERGDPGIDPSMDISDATMRTLINVDKDLKRAGLIKMGAPRGSQTNLLGALSNSIGEQAATHVLQGIPVVGRYAGSIKNALTEFHYDQMLKKHLAPPEGGYIYPDAEP